MSSESPLRLFRPGNRPNSSARYTAGQIYILVPVSMAQKTSTRKRTYDVVALTVCDEDGETVGEVEAPVEFGVLSVTAAHYGYGEMGRKFPAVCTAPYDRTAGGAVFAAIYDEKYIEPGPLLDAG